MDIKIKGLKRSILEQALEQARKGRLHILKEMDKCIKRPNKGLTQYAPRIITVQVNPSRVNTTRVHLYCNNTRCILSKTLIWTFNALVHLFEDM